jgi:alkaline phosphatase D
MLAHSSMRTAQSPAKRRFAVPFSAMLLVVLATACRIAPAPAGPSASEAPITRIAFGSCMNTNAHPMLDQFLSIPWDLALMLGDNIYADTTNESVMAAKYATMKQSAFWTALRKKGPVLATWDDHDFGWNDSGSEYPLKRESQRNFLQFMDEPADSVRWQREGIYDAKIFGPPGKRVQIILLDTRYFRSTLSTGINNVVPSGGRYIPDPDRNKTMLGEAQWKWLEEQLRLPAELRVIASSIQFISEFSGAEAWANFPHEKQRMLNLIENVNGVVFISGDRHWAELSRLPRTGRAPLYDLTSSALTQKHPRGTPTPNRFREGPTYHDANMGLILVDWPLSVVTLQLLDVDANIRFETRFPLN